MTKPQVTITLGRSGQKVVKDSWGDSGGGRVNASGSKRSFTESLGTRSDRSFKRMRDGVSARSYRYDNRDGSGLGAKDLRLKLMHKRMSTRTKLENEERKKIELHEKVSRTIQSLESPDRSHIRNASLSRGPIGPPSQVDPMGGPYYSWTSNRLRARSPVRIPVSPAGISPSRTGVDDAARVSSLMQMDAPRPVPMPITSRHPLGTGKMVAEQLPPATVGVSRPAYLDSQPLTLSSLLHSLGLGKYCINFQAEEIDIVALKQMGESDLKELGIPMGPRKKILLALEARRRLQQPRLTAIAFNR